jgi:hypothetical protein
LGHFLHSCGRQNLNFVVLKPWNERNLEMLPRSEGFTRRSDLALRAEFPQLETRIFELSPHRYVIVFDKELLDAANISPRFHNEIRTITANVSLSNVIPTNFIRELEPIRDNAIARQFHGLALTKHAVINLVIARFPELGLVDLLEPSTGGVRFVAPTEPSQELRVAIETFWADIANGTTSEVVVDPTATAPGVGRVDDPLDILSAGLRPHAPRFTREDEQFFFDNLDRLYDGQIPPDAFSGMKEAGFACYVDLSSAPEHVNLRQAVMLYDTVFLSPPHHENQEAWDRQRLVDADLLELIESGHVRVVLSQPEERCNIPFLEAAYERNPANFIGRRTAAAVILADLVETAGKYQLSDSRYRREIAQMSDALASAVNASPEETLKVLMWPVMALRKSIMPLMSRGIFGVPSLNLGSSFAAQIKQATGRDLALECLMLSIPVHVAHALKATLIAPLNQPNGWSFLSELMAQRLNFYRSFDTRIAAAWVGNEMRKEERRWLLPGIPLFDFDSEVSLRDIVAATRGLSTRRAGRALVARLADLSGDKQQAEIRELVCKFRGELGGQENKQLVLDSLKEGSSLVTDVLVGIPVLGALFFLLKLLHEALEIGRGKYAICDILAEYLQEMTPAGMRRDPDLDFLSKVSRVGVALKIDRVS